jgi:ABC-2 type transport system permease protein
VDEKHKHTLTALTVTPATLGEVLFTKDITSLFGTIKVMGTFLYAPALIYLFPQIPAWIGRLFPTYYVVQPVVEITQQGGTWSDVAFEVLVLAGLLVALLGAVAVAARRAQQREA